VSRGYRGAARIGRSGRSQIAPRCQIHAVWSATVAEGITSGPADGSRAAAQRNVVRVMSAHQADCNVRAVSEWAGHNSVAFTLTRYGSLFEDGSDAAIVAVNVSAGVHHCLRGSAVDGPEIGSQHAQARRETHPESLTARVGQARPRATSINTRAV